MVLSKKESGDVMKRFFKCFSITTVIWIVSRLIPAFISAIDPASSILRMAAFTLLLPLGWLAANAISNGKHPVCVRVNLYIFAFLEGNGIFSVLSMLMELSYSTGRYSTNVYGVDYDLYPLLIISALAFIAVYIGLCLYLAKATNRIPEKEIVKKENVPDDIPELKRWWYEDGSLFVQFQSGNIRKYIDVPKKMFNALCNTSPKSKYLFEYIVGNFSSEEIVSVSQKAKSEEKERIEKQKIAEELARLHKQTAEAKETLVVSKGILESKPGQIAPKVSFPNEEMAVQQTSNISTNEIQPPKKESWILRPASWIASIIMLLALQLAAELICRLGDFLTSWLGGLSTIAIVILVLLFGSAFCSLFFYSAFLLPMLLVSASDTISPSKHAFRYYFLGIWEILGCGFLIFAAIMGTVSGGSMFWFYARYCWLIIAAVVMMFTGRSRSVERQQSQDK